MSEENIKCLVVSAGSWHLPNTAKGFHRAGALSQLWVSDRNKAGLPATHYRQAKAFFWATKPLYLVAPGVNEWWFWRMTWLWRLWVRNQRFPRYDIAHVRHGYGIEVFDHAETVGALKVVDYCNSHASSQLGYWQRECDLWSPGVEPVLSRGIFKRMNRETARADLHLCPSDFVRDSLVRNGIRPEKCLVHPFGYNPSVFLPRDHGPRPPRFVFAGAISLRKGCQYLFPAFERVRREFPQAELICVGGVCDEAKPVFNKWRNLLTHVPWAPQDKVADIMRSGMALVMPSLEEGMARVLIEALGSGLPLIASYESGATPLARSGIDLLLVNPHDPEDIANKMLMMARDPDLVSSMARAASNRSGQIGSWEAYATRVLNDYRVHLNAKRKSS